MHVVPAADLDDAHFASALALVQRCELAVDPGVEPITAEELRRLIADDRTEGNRHLRIAVVDADEDDAVRALAHLELEADDANRHVASAEVFGAADDTEAGRVAVRALLDIAENDGRTTLLGWGPNTPTEHGFWTALGAPLRYTERMSVLDVTSVDAALMQQWIDARLDRAADVKLVHWTDVCPDEHLEAFATSKTAMNDAPNDEMEVNERLVDAAAVREDESARSALGTRTMTVFAIDPAGDPVGHTQVHVNPFRPDASWQWDTVVLDHHRRRGIGRWLKAEMWQWLRVEVPEVERLLTGNAESNAGMLAINVAMGFTEAHVFGAWQTDLGTYRANLI
jgi:mycothiol synthase